MSKVIAEEEILDRSYNLVQLCGRVSGLPQEKELPSGDKVVEFRLIVGRDSREGVDTLDIAAWNARTRRTALALKQGQWVEIHGMVHRRFWQTPTGVASRWQVESSTITKI